MSELVTALVLRAVVTSAGEAHYTNTFSEAAPVLADVIERIRYNLCASSETFSAIGYDLLGTLRNADGSPISEADRRRMHGVLFEG